MAGWLNRAGSPPNRMRRRPSDEHRRLDELAAGDLEVRASIALSYRALPDRQQRAFRRLGLLEALDFPAWVAAAVLDLDPARGEDLVDALVDAQLLETGGIDQVGQVRYRFHDLLRVYARERALSDDDPAERTAALMRGFGGWLLLAGQAATVVKAGTLGLAHGGALRWPPGPAISGLVDAEPLAWFEADGRAWWRRCTRPLAVAWTSSPGTWPAAWPGSSPSAATSTTGGGPKRPAWPPPTNRTGLALACLEPALAIFAEAGGSVGVANVRFSLGMVHLDQGNHEQAEACLEAARPVLEAAGDRYTLGQLLRKLAQLHRTRGLLDQAATALDRCLAVDRALGDRLGEALTLQSLGELQRQQDRRDLAQATLEQALAALREVGSPYGEALALRSLGLLHLSGGHPARPWLTSGRRWGAGSGWAGPATRPRP